jgi:hypothetical protein
MGEEVWQPSNFPDWTAMRRVNATKITPISTRDRNGDENRLRSLSIHLFEKDGSWDFWGRLSGTIPLPAQHLALVQPEVAKCSASGVRRGRSSPIIRCRNVPPAVTEHWNAETLLFSSLARICRTNLCLASCVTLA